MYERIPEDELTAMATTLLAIEEGVSQLIVGNRDLIEIILIGLLSEGHIIIEGVPGTAKTTLVKAMSALMGCDFRRVQCAVDIQPADITGIRVWDQGSREFVLKKGPIFSNIVLIDEINRLPPKSQSAFIEAMGERQTTIDGITLPIERPFFAIATQNPYEQEGTFPLIETQKDRFMFSIKANYLGSDEELEILHREHDGVLDWKPFINRLQPILNSERILEYITNARNVHIEPHLQEYIRDLVMATRTHSDIYLGASSRGTIALLRGAKASAVLDSRDFVLPDDIKKVAPLAFPHRMFLTREAEIAGITTERVVAEILDTVEVP
ncbi:MAG: MoxR family ATPase [Methanomicrobiaceae archaeon]|nr:MoxR family ATPase [Methanomicrobiaceae archaeon]